MASAALVVVLIGETRGLAWAIELRVFPIIIEAPASPFEWGGE